MEGSQELCRGQRDPESVHDSMLPAASRRCPAGSISRMRFDSGRHLAPGLCRNHFRGSEWLVSIIYGRMVASILPHVASRHAIDSLGLSARSHTFWHAAAAHFAICHRAILQERIPGAEPHVYLLIIVNVVCCCACQGLEVGWTCTSGRPWRPQIFRGLLALPTTAKRRLSEICMSPLGNTGPIVHNCPRHGALLRCACFASPCCSLLQLSVPEIYGRCNASETLEKKVERNGQHLHG